MGDEFGYRGALMASEIETEQDLFGAGGFMGDSEKAWDKSKANISMASKVLRVHINGKLSRFTPVKTGETSDEGQIKEGKFEADGTLSTEELRQVRHRAQRLATAEPQVNVAELQRLFQD